MSERWPRVRLGTTYDVRDQRAGSEAESLPLMSVSQTRGVVPRSELVGDKGRAEDLTNYKICEPGDIVLNRMSAYNGALGVTQERGVVSPDYLVMTPRPTVRPEFIAAWLKTPVGVFEMTSRLRGIGSVDGAQVRTPRVNESDLKTIALAMPPADEQRAIADYLDRETARIDTLIDEQQRLIEMLRERRWAVVERSVALLDWNTPFKAVTVLVQTGPFGSQLKSDEYEEGGTPIINPSHVAGGGVRPDPRIAVGPRKAKELARHAFQEGDLVAARRGELGRCAVVDSAAAGFLCGTGSALIRLERSRIEPTFAALVFGSRRNRDALALASVGSTMDNLNSDIIWSLRIPVPALSEQRRIVAEGNESTAKIDIMIAETERFIELSRERRSALITAAVTGQIDVRNEVA